MHEVIAGPAVDAITLLGTSVNEYPDILTPEALEFVVTLEREFRPARTQILAARKDRQAQIDAGNRPDFLPATRAVRENSVWRVGTIPDDLQDRRVEITGPVERKMMINALNSGASVFMADFEDANSPTWENIMNGHRNLRDAIDRSITFTSPDGRKYKLNDHVATLMVRPRGWHLEEKHVLVDGKPMSASLFDFGMYFFHQAQNLLDRGTGPYFYLPKLENHHEAHLWNSVFEFAQHELDIPQGTIKVTVLIETILAAFEMEEILYELRNHIVGLNAGRWDYMFSVIKKFRNNPDFLLPDRSQLTMTVPFMRAYTELLVKTCHKRGAHAIGGMAAFIPSRKDPKINDIALAKVTEDKIRESNDGFDGTWVAHPDLVPVARKPFDAILGASPHQKHRMREDVNVTAGELLNFTVPNATITETGLRNNINVGLQYIESWLRGVGAAGIFNLMEDAATAEISRSQVWQWLHHERAQLADGRLVNEFMYQTLRDEELKKIEEAIGQEAFAASHFDIARMLFDQLVTRDRFADFLTLEAYKYLD
ncbi:MAG: malate synthase A [Bacteroidetes bacterium]|nr:malate synthase A [Bacteroidota bacterium]MCW5896951.1 malate synthase A [Bacteroidota bacterium]